MLTTGNLPLEFKLRENSESGADVSYTESTTSGYKVLSFALNKTVVSNVSDSTTYYLKVSWPSSANSSTYANKVEEVVLNVYAVQID